MENLRNGIRNTRIWLVVNEKGYGSGFLSSCAIRGLLDHKDTKFPMRSIQGKGAAQDRYWKANLQWLIVILGTWFFVSFGCGILFREWLDENLFRVGTAPFRFWTAHQGSTSSFVLLLNAYTKIMNVLYAHFDAAEDVSQSVRIFATTL